MDQFYHVIDKLKNMYKLIKYNFILFLFSISCNIRGSDSIPTVKLLLSKTYSSKFTVESSFYHKKDSLISLKRSYGIIKRSQNYIFSKSDFVVGILEDSNCFFINNDTKTISIGPENIDGAALALIFYDPEEIMSYANEFSTAFQKYYEGKNLTYDFIFTKKDFPMYNISLTFYPLSNDDSTSLKIKMVYQRFNKIIKDVISYKFVSNVTFEGGKNIRDYLEIKNGKHVSKSEFKDFTVFDSYPLAGKQK
jgi:hypothetical protein